jgi:hypothetical protein
MMRRRISSRKNEQEKRNLVGEMTSPLAWGICFLLIGQNADFYYRRPAMLVAASAALQIFLKRATVPTPSLSNSFP